MLESDEAIVRQVKDALTGGDFCSGLVIFHNKTQKRFQAKFVTSIGYADAGVFPRLGSVPNPQWVIPVTNDRYIDVFTNDFVRRIYLRNNGKRKWHFDIESGGICESCGSS